MLFRSLQIGRVWGADIFLHWSMWLLPAFILSRGLIFDTVDAALMETGLALAVYIGLFVQLSVQMGISRWLRLPIRDISLYPIGGIARLAELGERPWKEIQAACVPPLVHFAFAAAIAAAFGVAGISLSSQLDSSPIDADGFFKRLFWLNVLLALSHLVPAFPMAGGRAFRGALALSTGRVRATEVSAQLSSFIALLFIVPGMLWISSVWWLIAMGIVIHISGQQELLTARFFASLQELGPISPATPPMMVPIDQMIGDNCRPTEPDFSGFIWNPKTRLWILWSMGQPISAKAVVGE